MVLMERLLVGLDFSKGSLHAFECALEIAKTTGAQIRLVWVDNFTSRELAFNKNVHQGRIEAKNNFEELFEQYSDHPLAEKMDYRMLKGKVGPEISRHARDYGADLVIAGSHGITGFEEYWIGSNANRIVIYSSVPVLTVRYDYDVKRDMKKILVPIDSTASTVQKLPFTATLAEHFGSEIHILGIYSTILKSVHKKVDNLVEQAKKYMEKRGLDFKKDCIDTDNIANDILRYVEEKETDLVSIMTEQETSTSNMLLGKYAYQIVNHSPVPVLSIQPSENFSLSS